MDSVDMTKLCIHIRLFGGITTAIYIEAKIANILQ